MAATSRRTSRGSSLTGGRGEGGGSGGSPTNSVSSRGNRKGEGLERKGMQSRRSTSASSRRSVVSGRRGVNAPSVVTEKLLASINYKSFMGPHVKAKMRRTKMMSEFLQAHSAGVAIFEKEWQSEIDSIFAAFREEAFGPQCRQILQLVKYIKHLKADCEKKLHFAESLANNMLSGVEKLLDNVKGTGLVLCSETDVLKYYALFVEDDIATAQGVPMEEVRGHETWLKEDHPRGLTDAAASAAAEEARRRLRTRSSTHAAEEEVQGVPMPEVRNHDAWLTDNNPPGVYIPDWEKDEVRTIVHFFNEATSLLACDALRLDVILTPQDMGDDTTAVEREQQRLAQYEAARARESGLVATKLHDLTQAMKHLMHRVKMQDDRNRRKIAAQQRAMDEGATREKIADDVLDGTVRLGKDSADYAIDSLRLLSAELRRRMDAVELDVKEDLQALISASADLCMTADAYASQTALVRQKEQCVYKYMTKTERRAVEQADILRDVQDRVMQLWSNQRGRLGMGREEKDTLRSRALPAAYLTTLDLCDRPTLIRLVHHLSVQSEDATKSLMGALDEYQHFLDTNTEEAIAVREEELKRVAVTKLLEKLHEEGMIHSNPRSVSGSLADMVEAMVAQYNAYIDFDEKCVRARMRRDEKVRSLCESTDFFSAQTPVPLAVTQLAAGHTPIANPYNRVLFPPAKPAAPAAARRSVPGLVAVVGATNSGSGSGGAASAMPRLSHAPSATPAEIISVLTRSHPSAQHRSCATVSVVGDGRWGGRAAAQRGDASCDGSSTVDLFAQKTPPFVTQPSLPPRKCRSGSVVPCATTAAVTAATASASDTQRGASPRGTVPTPGMPIRSGLIEHTCRVYNNKVGDLVAGTLETVTAQKMQKLYHDDDLSFINQQRALFKVFQE